MALSIEQFLNYLTTSELLSKDDAQALIPSRRNRSDEFEKCTGVLCNLGRQPSIIAWREEASRRCNVRIV